MTKQESDGTMSKNDEPSVSTKELLRVAREQSLRVAVELEDFLRMFEAFHSANSMIDMNPDRGVALMEMMSALGENTGTRLAVTAALYWSTVIGMSPEEAADEVGDASMVAQWVDGREEEALAEGATDAIGVPTIVGVHRAWAIAEIVEAIEARNRASERQDRHDAAVREASR